MPPPGVAVIGHFDPLLASHVRRLQEAARRFGTLVVVVTEPPDPLLPARARAELLAGLAMVAWVTAAPSGGVSALPPGWQTLQEEAGDLERRKELIRHVFERQPAG
jgi:hypothetical protein